MGLMALVMLATTFLQVPTGVHASDVSNERKQVKEKISNKESEISQVINEMEALHDKITAVEKDIQQNETKIDQTEAEILKYEKDFQNLVAEVTALSEQIEKRHDILKTRIASYQEHGGDVSYLEVIFNAKDFSEFISRVSSVTALTNADKELIEKQKEDREAVEEKQTTIAEKIDEQEVLMNELSEVQKQVKASKAVLTKSEKSLKNKENQLQKEKSKLTDEDKELAIKEEEAYREKLAAAEEARKAAEAEEAAAIEAAPKVASATTSSSKAETKNETKSSEESSQETTKQASKQSSTQATKQAAKQPTKQASSNNNSKKSSTPKSVGKVIRMEATGYGPDCAGCSGYTATGMDVRSGKQKVVAVDPSVIPLGTRVWVEGYGEAIAADTGGAIKGNKIDLLFKSEAYARNHWGRRTVTVKILN